MILDWSLLVLLIVLPCVAGTLLWLPAFRPSGDPFGARSQSVTSLVTLAVFIGSVLLAVSVAGGSPGSSLAGGISWIPAFGISFSLFADGFAASMVLLTATVTLVAVHWPRSNVSSLRGMHSGILWCQGSIIGAFLASDLLLFYVFFELMLVPVYFLVGVLGSKKRISAASKFVVFTVAGSLFMFLAMLYMGWAFLERTPDALTPTFAIADLVQHQIFSRTEQIVLFSAFLIACAIKIPLVPFHGWLPELYVEAPTPVTAIIAALMGKVGLYALIRIALPLFPEGAAELAPYVAALGAIGVVYGALIAWVQTDMKRMLAYSSISHLGFCGLGIAALDVVSISGVTFTMISHGIVVAALFLLLGLITEGDRFRRRDSWEGLAARLPLYSVTFFLFTLASIALPLTSGFVGEFLILAGSFSKFPWQTFVASLGVVLGAVYMLSLVGGLFFGKERVPEDAGSIRDLGVSELVLVVPLVIVVFALGIVPAILLDEVRPAVEASVSSKARAAQVASVIKQGSQARGGYVVR